MIGIHPEFGRVTLAQHLSTWTVHDLTHLAQIVRVMAKQYGEAVGPWTKYLSVLRVEPGVPVTQRFRQSGTSHCQAPGRKCHGIVCPGVATLSFLRPGAYSSPISPRASPLHLSGRSE